jgi:hypothetical protein
MRRLLRILLNAATVLSLAMCAVTMVFWVRSYSYDDAFGWRYGTKGNRCASSMLGEVLFTQTGEWRGGWHLLVGYRRMIVSDFERGQVGKGPYAGHYWHGFQWSYRPDQPARYLSGESYMVRVPHWSVVFTLLLLPVSRWLRHVRAVRRAGRWVRQGRCPRCGYDCRATPDRCPECGRVPAAAGL